MPHEPSVEHPCHGFSEPLKPLMLSKKSWAVVGASADPSKFGFKIVHRLNKLGYQVFPVNPNLTEVDGLTCYPSISALPTVPEVVDLVVSPSRGQVVLTESAALGIRLFWSQPGTYDKALQALADQLELCILQDCVLNATKEQEMGSDENG